MSGSTIEERVGTAEESFRTAVGWSFVMNAARLLSTLGTSILLAALLGPTEFGVVALALIFITLLQLVMQHGVAPAVIQRQDLTHRMLDSAFWLTMGLSAVLTTLGILLAGWWAHLNDSPRGEQVIWALSALVAIKGLVVVQEALLRRQMRFRQLAVRTTVASVLGAAVGLTWALAAPSVWALVAQQVTSALAGCVMLWTVSDWRPRLRWSMEDVRGLLGFAGKSSLSGFGVFVNNRVDALLVGLFFGPTAVGLYRLASRLVESAIEFVVQPIQHVALPEFARFQSDPDRARERYRTLVLASLAVGAPVMATVFATAEPFMTMMGDDWADARAALQLLTVVGLVRTMTMLNGPAIVAAGRPGAQAVMTWVAAGVSAVSFGAAGLALHNGSIGDQVAGMAASRAILYALVLLPITQGFLTSRIVGVRSADYARLVTPTVALCCGVAALGAVLARFLLDVGLPSVGVLASVGALTLLASSLLVAVVNSHARVAFRSIARRFRPPRSTAVGGHVPEGPVP